MQLSVLVAPLSKNVEVVERKGLGHPDTLCDRISELTSVLYSQHCIQRFGKVAHHWFDKVMLIGGEAELGFGHGRLVSPYEVILGGKAAEFVDSVEIPITEIFGRAARTILSATLKNFDPKTDLVVTNRVRSGRGPGQPASRYRPTHVDELVLPGEIGLVSNDCNLCAAYFPLSTLEEMVLSVDHHLLKEVDPVWERLLGSDIKTVGWRSNNTFSLVANVPFIAAEVPSHAEYLRHCERLENLLKDWLMARWQVPVAVQVNPERRWKRAYLTVTGTVADTGDVGVTGRGNRMNGLITPGREMSIEAVAGKNPLDHTGKLYNALSNELAKVLHEKTGSPCKVSMSTLKGAPLSSPTDVTVTFEHGDATSPTLKDIVMSCVNQCLQQIPDVSRRFIQGDVIGVC